MNPNTGINSQTQTTAQPTTDAPNISEPTVNTEQSNLNNTEKTSTINKLNKLDWSSTSTSEASEEEEEIPKIKPNINIVTNKNAEISFKKCLQVLLKYVTDYLQSIKDLIALLLAYIAYQLFGDLGFYTVILLLIMDKSIQYTKNETSKHKINKLETDNSTTFKNAYENLKVPEKNKIKLRKKINKLQQLRKSRHLRNSDTNINFSEEPVYLPSYPLPKGQPVKFLMDGQVENVQVTFEMDTGSPTSLISSNVWEEIENNEKIEPLELKDNFVDFNGNAVKVLAKYNLNLRLGNHTYLNHPIHVVHHNDMTKKHALLGSDCIRSKRLGIQQETDTNTAFLTFQVNNQVQKLEFNKPLKCFVTNSIEIETGQTELVTLSVVQNINRITLTNATDVINTHGMIKCPTEEDFLTPSHSLCSLDNQASFQIPVTNKKYGELKLWQGQEFGEFEPLEPGTLLQTTNNSIEKIDEMHKIRPDLHNTILQIEQTMSNKNNTNVNLINKSINQKINVLKFVLQPPVNTSQETTRPTFKQEDSKTYNISGLAKGATTNRQFWLKVFRKIKKLFPKIDQIIIDLSSISPLAANLIQVIHRNTPLKNTKLTLSHQDFSINRIKLLNDNSEQSSDFSESDFAENLQPKKRVEEPKQVWENLLKNCPTHLQNKIFYLLSSKYPNVVSKNSMDFGRCTLPDSQFKIELNTTQPFTTKPYPLNSCYQAFVKEIIDEMQAEGFLIEESSEYGSGVFVRARPSADGNHRIRLVYDLRKLNSVTKKQLHPIPSIKNLLQKLRNKKHWALVDLKDSYQSIELAKETRHLASIVTSDGQYTPTRMGYGFSNAPSFFSRVIARTISGIGNCFNYLDDIVLVADTPEELVETFDKVLEKLDTSGFRISLGKIAMFKRNLRILGVLCTPEGIFPDPGKVSAIKQLSPPETKLQMQRFIGTVNYQADFLPSFATMCEPLLEYVRDDTPRRFTLSGKALQAFNDIKNACSSETLLYFIDSTLPVFVEVDAAQKAFGGLCYQIKKYSKEDLPALQERQEQLAKKSPEQVNSDLQKVINAYVFNEDIPPYDHNMKPITEEDVKTHNPNINITTKTRITKDKIYVVQPCFFVSKKFTASQALSWSSLMKELSAILVTIQKHADQLALGLYTVVLSDCSSAIFLYQQSTSHSLMSRYLSKLQSYPFKILVRHKAGKHLKIADGISRFWTIEETIDKTGRVSHLAGILVKPIFPIGTLVTPQMIVTAIQEAKDPIVISTENPSITKACQTDPPENWPAKIIEKEKIKPDLPTSLTINSIGTQTGTRQGIPNREKGIKLDDRKSISILSLRKSVYEELNEYLSPDSYITRQMTEFPQLYQSLVKLEHNPSFQISNGLIMKKQHKHWVRYTPPSLRNHIITKHHMLGHFSHQKLTKIIAATDFWEGMAQDIKDFTSKCLSCLFLRGPQGPRQALGVPLAARTCDIFQLDTVSGLPTAKNKNFFCSYIDTFSRFLITFPLTRDKASETCEHLSHRVFPIIGSPRFLITDGASNMLKSEAFKELCAKHNIIPKIRSPYSSRSLGLCERVHRTVQQAIRSLTDSFAINWYDALPIATSYYNALPHTALNNYSPYEVFFGRKSPILKQITLPDTAPGRIIEVVREHKRQLKITRDVIERLDKDYKRKMRQKFGGIEKAFLPGQFVLTENKVPQPNIRRKLKNKFLGPLLVHHVNDYTLIVENIFNGKVTKIHKDLAKILPEKDIDKYDNLVDLAKIKCGSGFTYEHWLDLWVKGRLSALFQRSITDLQHYGDEGPLPDQCDIGDVELDDHEKTEIPTPPPKDNSNSDSSTEDDLPHPREKYETTSLPTQQPNTDNDKQVRFNLPDQEEVAPPTSSQPALTDPDTTTSRRSGRKIKPPTKLDL